MLQYCKCYSIRPDVITIIFQCDTLCQCNVGGFGAPLVYPASHSISAAKTFPFICSAAFIDCSLIIEQTIVVVPLFSANSLAIANPIPLVDPFVYPVK
jgi:hypothetical protein